MFRYVLTESRSVRITISELFFVDRWRATKARDNLLAGTFSLHSESKIKKKMFYHHKESKYAFDMTLIANFEMGSPVFG